MVHQERGNIWGIPPGHIVTESFVGTLPSYTAAWPARFPLKWEEILQFHAPDTANKPAIAL